jgi:class 3 adenylate cyclase/tetratricopeptide (TPR) repeat protein
MNIEAIQDIVKQVETLYNQHDILEAKSLGMNIRENQELISDVHTYSVYLQYMSNSCYLLSDFVDAVYFYKEAIRINTEIENKERLASAFGNIGLTKYRIADYTSALDYLKRAIEINEEIGNKVFLANNLGNVGIVFSMLSDFDKAYEYNDKALSINIEINNLKGIGSSLGNIGFLLQNQSKFEEALVHYQKALDIHLQIEDKEGVALSYENMGTIFIELQEYDKSLEYFIIARTIYQEIHNKHGIANVHESLGRVYSKLLDYEKAEQCLKESIVIAKEIEHKEAHMKALLDMSQIYEATDNYKEALHYYKDFISIRDTIQSDEVKKTALLFDQQRKIEAEDKARQLRIARMEEQEKLLYKILPTNIADRILKHESSIADYYSSVTVMFMDIVGFTELSSQLSPKQLVFLLDIIFSKADEVLEEYGLEKIKTIGDGYLAVANLTKPIEHHEIAAATAAVALLQSLKTLNFTVPDDLNNEQWQSHSQNIQMRIGLHAGEVIAGIVGKNKLIFDLWGDAVNLASRMESLSEPGRIQVSDSLAASIAKHSDFVLIPRGSVSIKGKGEMNTWWLEGM